MKTVTLIKTNFCELTVRKSTEKGLVKKPKIIPHYTNFNRNQPLDIARGKDMYSVVNYMVATHFDLYFLGRIFTYKANPIERTTMLFKRIE